jgi:S-DNA-T family DNA segregation ATPase FtsK/SpoIIIE
VYLFTGLFILLALASYNPLDPSWNTASALARPANLTGRIGAFLADGLLQIFGLAAYAFPTLILCLGWKWVRSSEIHAPWARVIGAAGMVAATCAALGLMTDWHPVAHAIPAGGIIGMLLGDALTASMNLTGALLTIAATWILGLYLVSTFEVATLLRWLSHPGRVIRHLWMASIGSLPGRWRVWREGRAQVALENAQARAERRAAAHMASQQPPAEEYGRDPYGPAIGSNLNGTHESGNDGLAPIVDLNVAGTNGSTNGNLSHAKLVPPVTTAAAYGADRRSFRESPQEAASATPPFEPTSGSYEATDDDVPEFIPIRTLEEFDPSAAMALAAAHAPPPSTAIDQLPPPGMAHATRKPRPSYALPSTTLLQEPPARGAYDSQELQDIALRIKSKFEEFNVRGNVVQINPGPVVTTFEFKPEAGMKYSRITTLNDDLCLALQAESVLIERLPGKSTIGIEVPNTKREVISLRQILESEEFYKSPSPLTVALGKDINGRIKVAALEGMPHLLIAGSTGSGKSVMLNSLIMSILYKATPDEVRMIMVDPKRLEFGLYEGIPHLLTPVITDAKKATYALRNAVLEMERRLKLLASQGVRNIEQYNRKIRQLKNVPRTLFDEPGAEDELETIPYILILIDELADLMMLERANVEESVTRLAQMARAVGMHLVLATQRPSVDVITGLIKANFPSRISFRVATKIDSRTVLDGNGAEHLLGKGDMLFVPPGTSRHVRVHGSYVSETETNDVVEFWKRQAQPDYDQTFLLAPPADDDEDAEEDELSGPEDSMYQEAVRIVVEMGKASTSTLQRRLRLGYGRAARILDMMQRDGIIGPPDGSRPREVLKRPDWLTEVHTQLH